VGHLSNSGIKHPSLVLPSSCSEELFTKLNNICLRTISRATKPTSKISSGPNVANSLIIEPDQRMRGHTINKIDSTIHSLRSDNLWELEVLLYSSTKNLDVNATKSAFDRILNANYVPSIEMYACCLATCIWSNNAQRTLFYFKSLGRQPIHKTIPPKFCQIASFIFIGDKSPKEAAVFAELGKKQVITSEEFQEAVQKVYDSPRYKLIV